MQPIKPLADIVVPDPKSDEVYETRVLDRSFRFTGLKALLGAADISKAGDRIAGLAASDDVTREAARQALSGLTLQHLYDRPLTDDHGRVDAVMRVNYDIDLRAFVSIAKMSLGALKDHLLRCPPAEVMRVGSALTGVMAAALVKLLDVHEMVLVARKARRSAKARTMLGLPGTLSSRLQPNHPSDNLDGITMLVYAGLSMGGGDQLIGVNPAIDTVDNVGALLRHLDMLRSSTGAPSQICVLSHVKTQLACLERGDPVEILFQSLAGTDCTLTEEFDVTVDLLDQAYVAMGQRGPLRGVADAWMYFETGQGSELTYGKHNGMDMAVCEGLCYGLARRYDPFMVNNVTGFIGPETHCDNHEMIVSNLQDHCMGKLMGLPMGMAPCYTLHSKITLEGQQMATQLLTAAGSNYYMDVYLHTDRMLAYFDTSGHDNQTLREVHGLRPAPEFLRWAVERGIFVEGSDGAVLRGPQWGNPRAFCKSDVELQRLLESLPAAHGLENAGPRPADRVSRAMRANLAVGREAVYADLRLDVIAGIPFRSIRTDAKNREEHLNDPELGARLADEVRSQLRAEHNDVQIVVSDGLSAEAIHHNVPSLLPVLLDGLRSRQCKIGQPILAPFGRVKLAEAIGDALEAKLTLVLIGERPGGDALASRSMSAYFAYRLDEHGVRTEAAHFSGNPEVRYEYSVVSNIYAGGLPPIEAGSVVAEKVMQILTHKAAGNRLERLLSRKASANDQDR